MDTPQKRLRLYIKEKYRSQAEFARVLDVSPSYLTAYLKENGSIFRSADIHKKLFHTGLNVEWYLTGEGSMLVSQSKEPPPPKIEIEGNIQILRSQLVEVPLVESAFPCGEPEHNECLINKILLPKDVIANIKDPYALVCKGNSMYPKIADGDIVIVETLRGDVSGVRNGDIVVAFVNQEFTIKRLYKINGQGYMLSPENQDDFKPYFLQPGDEMSVIAKVLMRITSEGLVV